MRQNRKYLWLFRLPDTWNGWGWRTTVGELKPLPTGLTRLIGYGYADLNALINADVWAHIYRFVAKPPEHFARLDLKN